MDGPRAPQETEWPRVVDFLNSSLRKGLSWSITDEYPLALHPSNLFNVRIITDDQKILSHAVLKYILIKTPIGFFKVAAIGSVVTSEAHRGQGLSQAILDDCIKAATTAGCDFAVLWTDLFEFYRKLGFELAGREVSLVLDKSLNLPNKPALKILESTQVSVDALMRLYAQHTVGSIRTAEDLKKNLTIPGSRLFTAWDENNILQAYAVEGKGVDLKNYIHEWGGGVSKLLPLFEHIRQLLGGKITILAPAHATNLLNKMKEQNVFRHDGYLGMLKILHQDNLIAKVKRYARSKGFEDLVLEITDKGLKLGSKTSTMLLPNCRDWTRLYFGPFDTKDVAGLDAVTLNILAQIFPIPMWIWGWDSV